MDPGYGFSPDLTEKKELYCINNQNRSFKGHRFLPENFQTKAFIANSLLILVPVNVDV
jgi:hypothetical protein